MRRMYEAVLVVAAVTLAGSVSAAQGNMETSKAVAGGGVSVKGWHGQVDANEAKGGQTVANAKLGEEGKALHVTTGPAIVYWNPANKASGNYTVKATFTEPKYMSLMSHPHPYGLFIGGNDLGTNKESLLYCAAYGNGTFIVRGFGPEPFQLNGRHGEANEAVHKAPGPNLPVSQDIALSVKGDKVECAINGKVVASYNKADVVGPNKLKSTDGIYGIRFAHNTDGLVNALTLTKP